MARLDAQLGPDVIDRLLNTARQNAAQLATSDDSGSAVVTVASGSEAGDWIPRSPVAFPGYQIVREVHRGGQGVVYQALRETTGEDVAIKVLHDRRAASPRELERFEREAAVLRELNHPNIIAFSEIGVTGGESGDGRPYLVMPYIAGWPLDEHVRRNGLSVRETLTLFAKVCDAVNAAHLNGVIHRDIKPSNVRVDDTGEPHALDFGLAKRDSSCQLSVVSGQQARSSASGSPPDNRQPTTDNWPDNRQLTTDHLTETGQFVGSLPWASPEQADPSLGRVDVRTDVYSLGAVLYQLLTGVLPIDPVGSQREVLNRIVTAEPVRLRA